MELANKMINELFFKSDVKKAINLIDYFILAKKEQIKIEPDEKIWQNELNQFLQVKELLLMDIDNFEAQK